MKIIITESQYHFLVEQETPQGGRITNTDIKKAERDRLYNNTQKFVDSTAVSFKGIDGKQKSTTTSMKVDKIKPIDPHTMMTILQIGTAFIPLVGPFISAGIGLADAAQYYQEGDTKTAGLVAMFSVIPGIGGLASKLGLTKWGAKAMGQIGKKISLGQKLLPAEIQVANKVVQNNKLIQSEIKNLRKIVKARNVAKKSGKFVAKNVVPYVGANVAYNKIYDKFNPQQQFVDFDKIDVNKISDANKQAALNIKF